MKMKFIILPLICVVLIILGNFYQKHAQDYIGGSISRSSGGRMPQRSDTCRPVEHIMFLKSHKCASSTLQTLFLKYGYQHMLSFALPLWGNYLGNPAPFRADMIPQQLLPPSGKIDIFCVHSRLNLPEHAKVLHSDTVYITAVRDPAELYESLYTYFKMVAKTHMTLPKFLSDPIDVQLSMGRKKKRYGPNMMLFNLGVNVTSHLSREEVQKAIKETDQIFDIVLITEKIDESLILMKEYLCWEFEDVAFLVKNARKDSKKSKMTTQMRQKLLLLNSGDVLLYNYFLEKHEEAVNRYGRKKMAEQVKLLTEYREKLMEKCKINMTESFQVISRNGYFNRVNAYKTGGVHIEDCLLLMEQELTLLKMIRQRNSEVISNYKRERL